MAIQNRRGAFSNFDPSKMLPGEFAVVQSGDTSTSDGKSVYIAFQAGQVKKLATYTDIQDAVESATDELIEEVTQGLEEDVQRAEEAARTLTIDNTLTQSGQAADAKKTGDEIAQLKDDLDADIDELNETLRKRTLSEEAKAALLNCFEFVAWINENGRIYYNALRDALYSDSSLVRIDAVFSQGSAVFYPSTPLNELKAYLTVTGYFNDGTTSRITDYALSGTLLTGTSTITVMCGGKTDDFSVSVSQEWDNGYKWLYKPSTDGLLSDKSYITMNTSGDGATERVVNNALHVSIGTPSSNQTQFNYDFSDRTFANSKIMCKAKIINTFYPYENSSYSGYEGGFVIRLSADGTSGCYVGIGNSDGYIYVNRISQSSKTKIKTNVPINAYHIFKCEINNGNQIFSIDGVEIFRDSIAASNCYSNRIGNIRQADYDGSINFSDGYDVDIEWVAYYEGSAT